MYVSNLQLPTPNRSIFRQLSLSISGKYPFFRINDTKGTPNLANPLYSGDQGSSSTRFFLMLTLKKRDVPCIKLSLRYALCCL